MGIISRKGTKYNLIKSYNADNQYIGFLAIYLLPLQWY